MPPSSGGPGGSIVVAGGLPGGVDGAALGGAKVALGSWELL